MQQGVHIEGMEELENKLKKISQDLQGKYVTEKFMPAAQYAADQIRARAPQGPTGNLKRSIVAKKLEPKQFTATVITAIDRKIAPHAHLVEFGTSARFVKKKSVMVSKGGDFFGTEVAPMPARPFFRPGWDAVKGKVEDMIKHGIKEIVEKDVH